MPEPDEDGRNARGPDEPQDEMTPRLARREVIGDQENGDDGGGLPDAFARERRIEAERPEAGNRQGVVDEQGVALAIEEGS